jgi:hypothetical protein
MIIRRRKITRTQRFLLAAGISLAMALTFCDEKQQDKLSIDEELDIIDNKIKLNKEIAELEVAKLGLKKTKLRKDIAESVENELIWAAYDYIELFGKPLPACKQCSEFKYLLILERAANTKIANSEEIKGALYNARNEGDIIAGKLEKIEEEYEKKFEHKTYEFSKAMAKYEMWFKKQAPKCNCSEEEYLKFIEIAIEADMPYIAKEEASELEIALRTEYKKKFKKQISDFEISMAYLDFEVGGIFNNNKYNITVAKTATGATAKYLDVSMGEWHDIKLDVVEWLDFVEALHKCRIDKWEKKYHKRILDGSFWHLRIFYFDKDELNLLESRGNIVYPQNWNEFVKVIEGMIAKIYDGYYLKMDYDSLIDLFDKNLE